MYGWTRARVLKIGHRFIYLLNCTILLPRGPEFRGDLLVLRQVIDLIKKLIPLNRRDVSGVGIF